MDMHRATRRLMVFAWSGTLGLLAAVALWLPFSRLALKNGAMFADIVVPLAVCWCAAWIVSYRTRSNPRLRGSWLEAAAERVMLATHGFLFVLALLVGILTFSFLATMLSLPLWDETLAAFDRAMGLDWVALLAFLNSHYWLSGALTLAYKSTMPQVWLLPIALGAFGARERLAEFMFLMMVCTIAVAVIGMVFPAVGATAYYKPAPELLTSFAPLSGMWHYEAFTTLRTADFYHLDYLKPAGVVQFPSYHTVLAILVTYALRDIRWLLWPVATVNALVIVATLPEGGHHLADTIGGAVIALTAMSALHAFTSRSRATEIMTEAHAS
jgi:membrane-associated phospholipid phosphatase